MDHLISLFEANPKSENIRSNYSHTSRTISRRIFLRGFHPYTHFRDTDTTPLGSRHSLAIAHPNFFCAEEVQTQDCQISLLIHKISARIACE